MSTLAEDLQTTANTEVVTDSLSYHDSEGVALAEGDRVQVALSLSYSDVWYSEPERPFDYGDVTSLNDDGTVGVHWESAGCSCTNPDGRVENTSDLTRVRGPRDEVTLAEKIARLSYTKGFNEGVSDTQRDIRDVLGLPNPSEDNDN